MNESINDCLAMVRNLAEDFRQQGKPFSQEYVMKTLKDWGFTYKDSLTAIHLYFSSLN